MISNTLKKGIFKEIQNYKVQGGRYYEKNSGSCRWLSKCTKGC